MTPSAAARLRNSRDSTKRRAARAAFFGWGIGGLQLPEVVDGRNRAIEAAGLVGRTRGSVRGIGPRADPSDLGAAGAQRVQREGVHLLADPLALVRRRDGIEAELARLLLAIHARGDEAHDLAVVLDDVQLRFGSARQILEVVAVALAPARVLAGEDLRAERRLEAGVDRREGVDADAQDAVVVARLEGSDRSSHPLSSGGRGESSLL